MITFTCFYGVNRKVYKNDTAPDIKMSSNESQNLKQEISAIHIDHSTCIYLNDHFVTNLLQMQINISVSKSFNIFPNISCTLFLV